MNTIKQLWIWLCIEARSAGPGPPTKVLRHTTHRTTRVWQHDYSLQSKRLRLILVWKKFLGRGENAFEGSFFGEDIPGLSSLYEPLMCICIFRQLTTCIQSECTCTHMCSSMTSLYVTWCVCKYVRVYVLAPPKGIHKRYKPIHPQKSMVWLTCTMMHSYCRLWRQIWFTAMTRAPRLPW